MKHKKGSWGLVYDAQGPCMVMHPSKKGVAIASLTDAHIPINGFIGIESVGAPERTANAYLIAAAPELYEALKTIFENLLTNGEFNRSEWIVALRQKAQAAIVKAEGN